MARGTGAAAVSGREAHPLEKAEPNKHKIKRQIGSHKLFLTLPGTGSECIEEHPLAAVFVRHPQPTQPEQAATATATNSSCAARPPRRSRSKRQLYSIAVSVRLPPAPRQLRGYNPAPRPLPLPPPFPRQCDAAAAINTEVGGHKIRPACSQSRASLGYELSSRYDFRSGGVNFGRQQGKGKGRQCAAWARAQLPRCLGRAVPVDCGKYGER